MSDLIETAKQLMALDDFRWRKRMARTGGDTCMYDGADRTTRWAIEGAGDCWVSAWVEIDKSDTLDLNDPATQGCVYAWCAEVFGAEFTVAWRSGISGKPRGWNARWYRWGLLQSHVCGHESKIEAACASLLGAR